MKVAAVACCILVALFALYCAASASESAPWRTSWPYAVGAALAAAFFALLGVAISRGL